jgi:HlyD family secretion protein
MISVHERRFGMIDSSLEPRRGPGASPPEGPSPADASGHRNGPPEERRPGASTTAPEPWATPGSGPPHRPRRRILPRLVALVVVAGAAGVGSWYYVENRKKDDGRLVLQGNVDVREVNLAFKVDGRIETLAVDEGDPVEAGQVLATLDARYFEDELRLARARRDNLKAVLERLEHGSRPEEIAEAKASLAERQAAMENARLVLKRREALMQKGSVTREEFDNARTAFEEAEARVRTAEEALRLAEIGPRKEDIDAARAQLRGEEASVSQAERRLADSRLIAPGAGEILTRARERGAIVAPGETVYALTLTSPVWVRTYVNEIDLGRVRPDMPAWVRTDSSPGKVYRGHVGFISPTAEFTPKTVETRELRTDLVYRLRIVVDNPDGGLRQGMPVTVRFDDEMREGGGRGE